MEELDRVRGGAGVRDDRRLGVEQLRVEGCAAGIHQLEGVLGSRTAGRRQGLLGQQRAQLCARGQGLCDAVAGIQAGGVQRRRDGAAHQQVLGGLGQRDQGRWRLRNACGGCVVQLVEHALVVIVGDPGCIGVRHIVGR